MNYIHFHREVCQNIFTNPRTVPTVKTVKYCTIPEPGAEAAAEADLDLRNTASAGEDEVLQLQRQPKSQRQGNRRVPVQVQQKILFKIGMKYFCITK